MKCNICKTELEFLSCKAVHNDDSDSPALSIRLGDRKYQSYECSSCGILYFLKDLNQQRND